MNDETYRKAETLKNGIRYYKEVLQIIKNNRFVIVIQPTSYEHDELTKELPRGLYEDISKMCVQHCKEQIKEGTEAFKKL